MSDRDILILKGDEVLALLTGREAEVTEMVRLAYESHARGGSSLPHSTFLRFPDERKNRIIALPAYVGQELGVAGVKWISSFPDNTKRGLDRASAVLVMNSTGTGLPEAFVEGSIISAKRTAASAALAARHLHGEEVSAVGLLGCGVINFEVVRFLFAVYPGLRSLVLFDHSMERAEQFREKCLALRADAEVAFADDLDSLLGSAPLISIATTAATPHIGDLSACRPGATILHVSLRDITAEAILKCDNVVDDVDHVCRAQTSVHLAEESAGHREFIRCTLADVLLGAAPARRDPAQTVVFSPFGLGVLDVAVGKLVCDLARGHNYGTVIQSFLPAPWAQRAETQTSGAGA
jgi:N-[(2S)-2-amino-2-carboxyethyl]-L-glutamate dehydrogenase